MENFHINFEYNSRKIELLKIAFNNFIELERLLQELIYIEAQLNGHNLKEFKGLLVQLPPLRAQISGIHEAIKLCENYKTIKQ
jgi:hypothetical protein